MNGTIGTLTGIIGQTKKSFVEGIVQIDAFEEQQKSKHMFYNIFLKSIEDILGTSVPAQDFVDEDINEEMAEALFENLLRNRFLKKANVKRNISDSELKSIISDY